MDGLAGSSPDGSVLRIKQSSQVVFSRQAFRLAASEDTLDRKQRWISLSEVLVIYLASLRSQRCLYTSVLTPLGVSPNGCFPSTQVFHKLDRCGTAAPPLNVCHFDPPCGKRSLRSPHSQPFFYNAKRKLPGDIKMNTWQRFGSG